MIPTIKTIALPVDENNFLQQTADLRLYAAGMGSVSNDNTNDDTNGDTNDDTNDDANVDTSSNTNEYRKVYHPAHTLQQTEMYSILLADCAKEWPDMGKIKVDASQMCTRVISGDKRRGDSGGPLVMRDEHSGKITLYGVTSWGADNYKNGASSGFHYVPTSLEWIRKTANMKSVQISKIEETVDMLKDATEQANNASTSAKETVAQLAHATKQASDASTIATIVGCVNTVMIVIALMCLLVRYCRRGKRATSYMTMTTEDACAV